MFRWSCHHFDSGRRDCYPEAGPSTHTVAASCKAVISSPGCLITQQEVSVVLSHCLSQDDYMWPHGLPASVSPCCSVSLRTSPREEVIPIHDLYGFEVKSPPHQTLHLMRHRVYCHGLDMDVKDYMQCCKRCVFGKSPEFEARAALNSGHQLVTKIGSGLSLPPPLSFNKGGSTAALE